MNHEVRSIIKRAGIAGLAKRIAEDSDSLGLTEHEFVDLLTSHSLCEHPRLSGAQAFAKAFTAPTLEGEMLRKAHDVIKRGQFVEPKHDDSAEAISELQRIGKQRWPSLKPHQQFSRAMETEIALAQRALSSDRAHDKLPVPALSETIFAACSCAARLGGG
jgi:hypothetical protein